MCVFCFPIYYRPHLLAPAPSYLRGGVVNRTYGRHKNLYIHLFLPSMFGPIYYGPPPRHVPGSRLSSPPSPYGVHCNLIAGTRVHHFLPSPTSVESYVLRVKYLLIARNETGVLTLPPSFFCS